MTIFPNFINPIPDFQNNNILFFIQMWHSKCVHVKFHWPSYLIALPAIAESATWFLPLFSKMYLQIYRRKGKLIDVQSSNTFLVPALSRQRFWSTPFFLSKELLIPVECHQRKERSQEQFLWHFSSLNTHLLIKRFNYPCWIQSLLWIWTIGCAVHKTFHNEVTNKIFVECLQLWWFGKIYVSRRRRSNVQVRNVPELERQRLETGHFPHGSSNLALVCYNKLWPTWSFTLTFSEKTLFSISVSITKTF